MHKRKVGNNNIKLEITLTDWGLFELLHDEAAKLLKKSPAWAMCYDPEDNVHFISHGPGDSHQVEHNPEAVLLLKAADIIMKHSEEFKDKPYKGGLLTKDQTD